MPSLKQITSNKNKAIDSIIADFSRDYSTLSEKAQRELRLLFNQPGIDLQDVLAVFSENGFDVLSGGYVDRYAEVLKFSGQIAKELGYKFAPTAQALNTFEQLQNLQEVKINAIKSEYIADMAQFGIRWQLENQSAEELKAGLEEKFLTMGRRLETEINTGIAISEAVVKKDLFEQAGIELFYYDGPDDDKTRDECSETLQDEKQATGWTMEQIEKSKTPYIERGGYNCRHEWLPMVDGEEQKVETERGKY